MILLLPVTTFGIALGVYLRTSPYEPAEAVLHIVALAGCDAARAVGVAPAYRGGPGYHLRNDPDGDGVACGSAPRAAPRMAAPAPAPEARQRMVGSAKFVRP
ncbi:excalibur calcium-binding domain-containing protein [Ruegeria sediminis]|uniref:Excalibur calcium-binding domain-containing protein n=2 Tax=Ruegeria sediminis TaxID=2583820 RepID=A0ABY2X5M1_9RHOB|nr:excalibur calcium-binding domain-containing protein [Ruegeria sediminis]